MQNHHIWAPLLFKNQVILRQNLLVFCQKQSKKLHFSLYSDLVIVFWLSILKKASYGLLNIIFEKYVFDDQNEILHAKSYKNVDFQKLRLSPLIIMFIIQKTQNVLILWRSGSKGTIYTRPDKSQFFCTPTNIWLRVVTTTWLVRSQ